MRRVELQVLSKVLLAIGAAFGLFAVALSALMGVTQPVHANTQPVAIHSHEESLAAVPPGQAGTVLITKSATTAAAGDGSIVADGGWITYTITVQNNSGATLTSTEIVDILEPNTFEEGSFQSLLGFTATFISETTVITDRDGNILATVKETKSISWTIGSLPTGQTVTRQFRARVICRANGSSFNNNAVVYYNGGTGSELSNPVNTTVQVSPPSTGAQGQVSNAPTFCSTEPGGAYDMDWGDYDRDGDLDLALGFAAFGARVYRNDGGHFTQLPQVQPGFVFGVHWVDAINNNSLELVVVGPFTCGGGGCIGNNSVYRLSGGVFTQPTTFTSDDGLFRVAAADYNGNGTQDLATAVYWSGGSNTDCKARLHRGNGAGTFNNHTSAQTICLMPNNDGRFVRSVAWGDYDNNGEPDLATGRSDGLIQVFINTGAAPFLGTTNSITVATVGSPVYSLAWGDYDRDGFLDLAAALETSKLVRIFHNNGAGAFNTPLPDISTGLNFVRAVEWIDFNGDGGLELAVGDTPPKIYDPNNLAVPVATLSIAAGSFYSIRGGDHDNDGDRDVAVANLGAKSVLFNTAAPFLDTQLTPVDASLPASSVAWGDANGDGRFDLLLGATASANRLYRNSDSGAFSLVAPAFLVNGRSVAFGNVEGDTDLDIAFGRAGKNQLYLNNAGFSQFPTWTSGPSFDTYSLVFGDFDQDNGGQLELLAGNFNGVNVLYGNAGLQTNTSAPVWLASAPAKTRQVAWGYYDSNPLPDFAAANEDQPIQIYRNEGGDTFTIAQSLTTSNTRSVAWGDYDHDGDMDLAVGNYGQPNRLYQNNGGNLTLVAGFTPAARNTTSLAWGDWDNDGDLDLAVGNDGQPNQVYANLDSTPGSVKLFLLWQSQGSHASPHVAWGDADGDGDLDLAVASSGQSGFYRNNYVLPAHLNDSNFARYMPLPHNPSYLSIARPGNPDQVWKRSVITQSNSLTIPIAFTLFSPDGSRQSATNVAGDPVKILSYQYSLNGSAWITASGVPAPGSIVTPQRQGLAGTFQWSAWKDLDAPAEAVSDDVRFRITIAQMNKAGPVQRDSASAASPPFRVRNLACVWPENPSFTTQPVSPLDAGVPIQFIGDIAQGSDAITFTWDFGDNSTNVITRGQVLQHTYATGGVYTVTLTVTGKSCPVSRSDTIALPLAIGIGSLLTPTAYLPIIPNGSPLGGTTTTSNPPLSVLSLDLASGSPAQVTGLLGYEPGDGTTRLEWAANDPADGVLGYRIYRSPAGYPSFQLAAEIPAAVTTYTDNEAACGQMYFVTASNDQGESLPSTASYFSPPCP